jgi:hypothetical protein
MATPWTNGQNSMPGGNSEVVTKCKRISDNGNLLGVRLGISDKFKMAAI